LEIEMMAEEYRDREAQASEASGLVSAFEQILEVMPDDRPTLEALHDAYLSQGDTRNALKHLLRLADLVARDDDSEALMHVMDKLYFLGDIHPEARERAVAMEAEGAARSPEGSVKQSPSAPHTGLDIGREISLAWTLVESEQITREEYTAITNDLTELSGQNLDTPVSVLHAIHERGLPHAEQIMVFLSETSKTPMINLSSFEIQPDVFQRLPVEYATQRGSLAFGMIGEEVMVAVLNPLDSGLRDRVRKELKTRCHFYLVRSTDYGRSLRGIMKILSDTTDA
jgi:hypothetical protein